MNLDQLRDAIIEEFSSQWQLNDRGHRIEHFRAVEKCGNFINEKLGLGYDPKLIMLVAFFHDMFSFNQCRENHQLLSGLWIETSKHPTLEGLSPEEITLVANACREHRASFKGEYSHEFSMLMASADRGFPGKVEGMLERAILYRVDRGADEVSAREGAIAHLKEKFGSQGYAKYPKIYTMAFGDELENQRKLIDRM